MNNQKGITLVALILCVVVLVVFAGISVALVLTDKGRTNDENNTTNTSEEPSYYVENTDDGIVYDSEGNPITTPEEDSNDLPEVDFTEQTQIDSNLSNNTTGEETNTVSNEVSNESL